MKCPICNKGTLKRKVIDEEFEYKGQKITLKDYVIYTCDHCGDSIVNKGTLKKSGKILKKFQREVDELLVHGVFWADLLITKRSFREQVKECYKNKWLAKIKCISCGQELCICTLYKCNCNSGACRKARIKMEDK